MNLDKITDDLLTEYKEWKLHESEKNSCREEFFQAAEEDAKTKTLARKTIRVVASSSQEARAHAEQYYSKWNVIDIEELKEDYFSVTLEEDPKYLPFAYVNRRHKIVFKKEIQEQGALIDDDVLREKDPDLWEEITYVPERQVKNLEELSSEQLSKLQDYLYRPAPKLKLAAPRPASDDELEEE